VVYEHRSIGDAGDRGGERPVPLPVSPSPTGRFPHRYTASEEHPPTRFQARTFLLIPLHSPDTAIQGQSPCTARPLSRGREEAAERPGGGGGL